MAQVADQVLFGRCRLIGNDAVRRPAVGYAIVAILIDLSVVDLEWCDAA